jgi:branched-chain amino acid transport system ATP-binding protein
MSDIILETRQLTKEFKGFTAVSKVNLSVVRGSIHALIGPNGAGKTTCFNLLTKFLEPTSGTILFNGQDITSERPAQIARRGIIRSFQISAVFPHLTLLENVRWACSAARHLDALLATARSRSPLNARDGTARAVGLGPSPRRDGELPYGRKRALRSRPRWRWSPELMLLDEPRRAWATRTCTA